MSNQPLLGLQWSAPEHPEIFVKAILSHGDYDVFEEKVMRFWDGEIGRTQAALAIKAIPVLSQVLMETRAGNLDEEEIVAKVAEQLNAPADELFRIFKHLINMDLKYEQYARIVGMTVEHRRPEGTQRAVFSTSEGSTVKQYVKVFDNRVTPYLKNWS